MGTMAHNIAIDDRELDEPMFRMGSDGKVQITEAAGIEPGDDDEADQAKAPEENPSVR